MEKKEEYIAFLASEDYKNQIDIWYKIHNITNEKIELYYDFLISIVDIIEETYLGPDVLQKEEDIKNHFTWCFNEVISNFKNEKIEFNQHGSHYDYLWLFLYQSFYTNDVDSRMKVIREYFTTLFNFEVKKTKIELDMLTDIYKLLDQNLKR